MYHSSSQDDDSRCEVDEEEGMMYAEENGYQYFECCAERFINVDAPFNYIATKAADRYKYSYLESKNIVQ